MVTTIPTPLPTAQALPRVLVLDTCVLLSNLLRRWLLRLAQHDCLQPAWSPIIGDEWRRNASKIWGVEPDEIQAQWLQLQHDCPGADVGDVQAYKSGLLRSDPKDWHVIAAARKVLDCRPGVSVGILTRNLRDFNRSELRALGISLFDPDTFLLRCWQHYPDLMDAMIQEVPLHALSIGKPVEAIDVILKRERLFRLNRVYTGNP
ncbi:MAG: PIN domain-containing protein [Burkholderiaceae bacterium]|nr:PIN domain-containing protein [Burkholderiaceae bacterium]